MQTVELGRTGLEVSVACLGAGGKSRLGKAAGASFEESVSVVKAALDAGVTFIDTAAAYGTESIVGAGMAGQRDRVVVSTKIPINREGFPSGGNELIDRREAETWLELSLKELKTDYVDVLHLHGVPLEQYDYCANELLPALLDFKKAGKVRFIGLTERFNADTQHSMLDRALQDDVWEVVMVGLNFMNQTALRSVLPTAERKGIGTMCMFAVRGPLATPAGALVLLQRLIETGEVDAGQVDKDDALGFLTADGAAASLTDAAYRFCRHAPGMDVVLTGTGNVEHLQENIRSINGPPLPPAVTERLTAMFGSVTSESGQL